MRASPSIYHSQERKRSHDAHPELSIRAKFLPARGRMILGDCPVIDQVIRPLHSLRDIGANRRPARHLPVQQVSEFRADRYVHFNPVLSKKSSLAGSTYAGKRGQKLGNLGQTGAA